MNPKGVPARAITVQDELKHAVATLRLKWQKKGRPTPTVEQADQVVAVAYMALIPMQTAHYRFIACGAPTVFVETYWLYPDFVQELLAKARKELQKRDPADVLISQLHEYGAIMSDADCVTHLEKTHGYFITVEAFAKKRQRVLKSLASRDKEKDKSG